MTLPPTKVLGAIIAAHTRLFTGPHRLAVQDRTARLALASGGLTYPSTDGVMYLLPNALPAPRREVVLDRAPGRQIARQQFPRAATAEA